MSPRSSRSRSPRDERRRNRSRTPLNGQSRYTDAGSQQPGLGKNSQQDRRVYVGNLSYEVKWPQLKEYLGTGMAFARSR
jgi:RNA recognition motif-containing protein